MPMPKIIKNIKELFSNFNNLLKYANEIKESLDTHILSLNDHKSHGGVEDVHGLLSGGNIIEEFGENQNGSYLRFSNGTQICWGTFELLIDSTKVTSNIFYYFDSSILPYAADFIEAPRVTVNYLGNYVTGGTARIVRSNNFAVRMWFTQAVESETRRVQYIAIGRWK